MISGAVKKIPGVQRRVEPAADDDAEQDRRDDRPAQNADLAEPRSDRRLRIVAELAVALRRQPRRLLDPAVALVERGDHGAASPVNGRSPSPSGRPPGLSSRISWRSARACSCNCSTLARRSASSSAERCAATSASRRGEVVAERPTPAGDRDAVSAADRQHAAAERAVARCFARARPAYDRRRQHGQEIGVTGQDAECAARVLGADRTDVFGVDQQGGRRRDRQVQGPAHAPASAGRRSA